MREGYFVELCENSDNIAFGSPNSRILKNPEIFDKVGIFLEIFGTLQNYKTTENKYNNDLCDECSCWFGQVAIL